MRPLATIMRRLRVTFRTRSANQSARTEMQSHLEREIAANLAGGLAPAEARRRALLEFGGLEELLFECQAQRRLGAKGVPKPPRAQAGAGFASGTRASYEALQEESRDVRAFALLAELMRDLRFACRQMRRAPGFSAIAIATLALGIGCNTAIFTLLDAAAFRLVNVPQAARLVAVAQHIDSRPGANLSRDVRDDETYVSVAEYQLYATQNHVFSGLMAYAPEVPAHLDGAADLIHGNLVTCNYFSVLDIQPSRGRALLPADCAPAATGNPIVLSDAFARRQGFSLGQAISLNNTPFTVVGIAPAGFSGADITTADYWAPYTAVQTFVPTQHYLTDTNMSWLAMVGRLRDGVSRHQAAADLAVIATRLNAAAPGRLTSVTFAPLTLLASQSERGPFLLAFGVILAATGLVLLLACCNLANMLLARATARRKEIALRLALGARRARILRQLLAESLVLALLGGLAGMLAAIASAGALLHWTLAQFPAPPEFAFGASIAPDARTLAYAFALSLATVLLFGLVPALRASRLDLNREVNSSAASAAPLALGRHRLRNSLVAAQVAFCMVLLLAGALLLRGLVRARTVDPGFDPDGVTSITFDLATAGYTPARAAVVQQQLAQRLAALPGVALTAQAEILPLSGNNSVSGFRPGPNAPYLLAEYDHVSPSFFAALHLRLISGRPFTPAEARAGAPVAVLTQATAQRLFPGVNPVGKALYYHKQNWQVVGVTANASLVVLGQSDSPYVFLPASPDLAPSLNWIVRSRSGATLPRQTVLNAITAVAPNLPVTVSPLADNLSVWRQIASTLAAIAIALASLALFLAALGIYGSISYRMSWRIKEIGIRLALGGDRRVIQHQLLRQSLTPVLVGAALGCALAAAISGPAAAILFGVSPWDPIAFTLTPLFLLAVAAAAAYAPTRRALASDPLAALHCE